jgi:hypothetical protein
MMSAAFGREALLDAFDQIGRAAALAAKQRLENISREGGNDAPEYPR